MSNEEAVVKPVRKWARRLGRGLLYMIAALFVLGFAAKTIWKYSGSNRWELVAENKKTGVKVYALKSPGSELEQTKAVGRLKTSMGGIVKFFSDADVCKRMGCDNSMVVERVDDQLWYTTFRFPYPGPFRPREFVNRAHFSQNPKTKELLLEYSATPELLPPNDCCVRVTRFNNMWRFRPVGNGEVETEVILNMDEGGFLPDFLLNLARRRVLLLGIPYTGKLMNKPRYQQARFAFVQEP
jgi:hypothetical protein